MKDELDQFHWHEALHTAFIIQNLINNELIDHHTYAHLGEEQQLKIAHASQLLHDHYIFCCLRQDEQFAKEHKD